ncbi:MAG: hypothetical protein ACRDAU_17775 [Clostridium sp.]
MEIKVKVLVEMPGVMESLLALAEAFEGYRKDVLMNGNVKKEIESEIVEKIEISIEEIRAILTKVYRDGKRNEVLRLLREFGCEKLIELPKEAYPEVLKRAEELERRVA